MENWQQIKKEVEERNNDYEIVYDKLTQLLSKVNCVELFEIMSADYYCSILGKQRIFELAEAEYIAGICVSSGHDMNRELKEEDYNEICESVKVLGKQQVYINMYASLCENDTEEDIYIKMFSGELKNSYSFTRGYSWYRAIEENNIIECFGYFNAEIEKMIGFYPEEAFKITDAYATIIHNRLKECSLELDINCTVEELFEYIISNGLEMMSVERKELLSHCSGVKEQHIDSFMQFFASRITSSGLEDKVKYFTDDNYFSSHPILLDKDKIIMINHQIVLWNLRVCVEEIIKQNTKKWNEYDKNHKAKFLEDKSAELIRAMLPQCDIHTSLYYKPENEVSPCELDAIAIYDKIVILIEAKSGIYSKPARRGGLKRLENVVRKNIEYAYNQGERTREYIYQNKKAVFYSDPLLKKQAVTLMRDDIADVFIINTTIEYYAELGVDLYKLRKLGLYKSKEFPWTVCISDLEVIKDFMDFPNQFIYYMYLRRAINNNFSEKNGAILLYELDLLAMYKTENTEKFRAYDLISEGDKQVILENGNIATCTDYTEYFKEYYDAFLENGKRPKVEPKKYNPRFLQMIRQLEEYNTKGMSIFALRMLDLDLEDQNGLIEQIDMICEKSLFDGKMHVLTIKRMPQHFFEEPFGMVIYSGYEKNRREMETRARVAGAIQQGQTGLKDWITLCIYHDDNRHFVNQFYFHSGSDELIEEMRAITNHIPVTAPRKIYPNDICPCGSGLKFKKCCKIR